MIPLRDDIPAERFQLVCLLLVVLNTLVFLYELAIGPDQASLLFGQAGVVPDRFFADGAAPAEPGTYAPPLTLLTATFLHAGWLHLLGNMWFLWVFGDNVEDAFGRLLFLPFYFACAAAAAIAQIFSDPVSTIPMIGASGAVAGVLGAYLVLFPMAQVDTFVVVRLVRLPAVFLLGLWFLFQLTGLLGPPGVAWWAHVGGFCAGAVMALLLRLFRGRDDDRRIGGPPRRRQWSFRSDRRASSMIRLPPEYR